MAHDCDTEADPDGCFRCKMRYVRAGGAVMFSFGRDGRQNFHGDSIAVREKRLIAEMRAAGREPERVA